MPKDAGWKYPLALTLLILAVTSLPYAFAYATAPSDRVFVGIQLNTVDHFQYFSWMRAHEESFLISNRMTPEPNEPVFFNLLWWAMAQLARVTGWDYAALYQLLRWGVGLVYGVTVYAFCALCLTDRFKRLLAFTVIMLASGLGWVLVAQKQVQGLADVPYPLALYVPETNSFLAMLGYPHFVIAAAHMVGAIGLYLVAVRRHQLRWAALAGVVGLSLGLQHAYDLITIYGVLGAFVALRMWRSRRILWFDIGALAVVGILSVGPPAYFFLLTSTDAVWGEILDQFALIDVWTPGPIQLVVLMGLLLPLGFAGAVSALWRSRHSSQRWSWAVRAWTAAVAVLTVLAAVFSLARSLSPSALGALPVNAVAFTALIVFGLGMAAELLRNRDQDESDGILLLKVWALAHLFIVYIPLKFQIHLLNPWQVPLGILAALFWLDTLVPWVAAQWPRSGVRNALAALLVLLLIPTNVYLFAWRFVDLQRYDPDYFVHQDDMAALAWLDASAGADDVVLSSVNTGRLIPNLGGSTAFAAHYAMTLDYRNKTTVLLPRFFDAETDDTWREEFVRTYNVRYVFYGEQERALGGFAPEGWPVLEPAFSQGGTTIYRVTPAAQ